jgi:hypothetical protein
MGTVLQARPWVRLYTSVLAGAGLAVFGFGLAGGIAPRRRGRRRSHLHRCGRLGLS